MKTIVKTTAKRAKWMGHPGVSHTLHLDKRPFGLRISYVVFDNHDGVNIELIRGDGRTPAFMVYAVDFFSKTTEGDLEAKVQRMLEVANTL